MDTVRTRPTAIELEYFLLVEAIRGELSRGGLLTKLAFGFNIPSPAVLMG